MLELVRLNHSLCFPFGSCKNANYKKRRKTTQKITKNLKVTSKKKFLEFEKCFVRKLSIEFMYPATTQCVEGHHFS